MLPVAPIIESKLIALLSGGASERDVANALGISPSTVHRYAVEAENAQVIRAAREALRRVLTEELAAEDGVLRRIAKRLRDNADTMLPRDVDALARALSAVEKTHANLAGENRRAANGPRSVTVNVSTPGWLRPADVVDAEQAGRVLPAVATPPCPRKTDGAPPVRGEFFGEDINSSREGDNASAANKNAGVAETDVPIEADFEV